jgi:microcompartment protein CcmK/EutM
MPSLRSISQRARLVTFSEGSNEMSKKAFDKIAAGLNEAPVVARGSWQRAKSRAVIKDRDGTVPDFMIGRCNGRNFVRVKPATK